MAAPLVVPLTPNLIVAGDYIIRITALDATTGNVVSGVNVSTSAVLGTILNAGAQTEQEPVPMPYLVPEEV